MPERQPGFLVNVCLFVAGSSAMARVSARGSGVCPFRTKRGSSGVGVSLVLQGHDSGGEKECGRRCSKIAPKWRVFVTFRPRFFMPEPRWARSGVRRCPPSLCAHALSQRRRVRGSQHRWGPNKRARVSDLTRCWISFEVHVLARIAQHGVGPKQGACACGIRKQKTALLLPEEWGRCFSEEGQSG